jgi:hypothetical protein
MNRSRWFSLLLLLAALPAYAGRPLSAHAIPDEKTWNSLAARPQSAAAARTEVVKFLLDLEDGRRIWFTDTNRYPIHYFFARDHIPRSAEETRDHGEFNRIQYRDDSRRFEMGSIVHYLDSDEWTLEIVSGDTLDGERIVKLYESVRATLWKGDRLRFRPTSALHETNIAQVRERLPTVTADQVFAGIRYQPLTTGVTYGFLRLVKGTLDPATVRADQILVLEHLPDEIPVSAGVISRELQAPLGHIAILCATRGTPNIAVRDAFEREDFSALDGKLVALDVNMQEFSIRAATRDQAEKAWKKRRPKRPQVPALDTVERRLVDVSQLKLTHTRYAGAKAAQLGEVMHIDGLATPGGFVIPLSYYLDHALAVGVPQDLAAQLADPGFAEDTARRARWLESVRNSIQKRAIDPVLIKRVRERIQQIAPGSRWILRSSTNAGRCADRGGHRRGVGQRVAPGRVRRTRVVSRRSFRRGHGHSRAALRRRRHRERGRDHREPFHRAAAGVLHQRADAGRQRDGRGRQRGARTTSHLYVHGRVRVGVADAQLANGGRHAVIGP